MEQRKICPRCEKDYPLDEDNFYVARPSGKRKKETWQPYCRECWKKINADNKLQRKLKHLNSLE